MTNLSDLIASPDGSRLNGDVGRVERAITTARITLGWESVWPKLWPATGILGAFLAAGLFGLFDYFPWEIHTLILLGAFGAAGYFLYENFKDFQTPTWEEGARRVERDSALEHRPITEQRDRIAVGVGDAYAEALWRAHIRSMLARIGKLRVSLPSSKLQQHDPYYLRYAILLLLIAGFLFAGSQWRTRLALTLSPDAGSETAAANVDAWINPPAYTGLPPVYLRPGQSQIVSVPAGSELIVRVHQSSVSPDVVLSPAGDSKPTVSGSDNEYGANTVLRANERIFVRAGGRTLGNWQIRAIPDDPPHIVFSEPPSKTKQGAVKLSFTAADDYGVVSVRAILRPLRAKAKGALSIDLPLDAQAKTVTQTVYHDLTENPFAGLPVSITLEAKDGAGQTATSKSMNFILPARVFTDPLARALVEQRQNLSVDAPHAKPVTAATLDALTLAPEIFFADQDRLYLILRGTYWALRHARDANDIARVQDMLWQTAMALDNNGAASAAEQLRAIQQLLSQALAQGAPQDVIDALMQRYQQAMQQYLRAMAQNAKPQNGATPPGTQTVTQDDIDRLMQLIQKLEQSGSREAAAQMLAMLQNLLENMQMAGGAGSGSAGDKDMSDAIQGLSDLMGRQRQLMDKTYRQGQGAGDPKDGGAKGLAQQQGKLRDDLNTLLGKLGKKAGPSGKSLGDAGKDMGGAQGQLGGQDFDGASQSEQQALDAMRQGAGALAKSLMAQSGQSKDGGQGNDDPLGRPQGARGGITGGGVKIPDKDSLDRARGILQELRKRAGQNDRSKEELDYLDRLLKQF
jgi:uncharacterized protein (TIGR02302 family)